MSGSCGAAAVRDACKKLAASGDMLQSMHRQRKREDEARLEFEGLAESAVNASAGFMARKRALRPAEREGKNAVLLLNTPWELNNKFNGAWLGAVAGDIERCGSLREGLVPTVRRLSELLDLEIQEDGHDPEWGED